MNFLVTGGAGYIGSHTALELLRHGDEVTIIDNLINSKLEAVKRVEKLAGKKVKFINADVRDRAALDRVFSAEKYDCVIHFAGLKAVGESVTMPLEYYDNNVYGTLILLEAMRAHDVKNICFSSSATVYGLPKTVPIKEDFPLSATNPYGETKLVIENILRALYASDKSFNIALLRYFNPVGADESGLIGEDPNGIPNNLAPIVARVAVGKLPFVNVYGNDYDTPDGTGVRDYIHVKDLAYGHVLAAKHLATKPGLFTVNLGTGKGYSVLEVIDAFSRALGIKIPYKIAPRRSGDIATCYADTQYAKELLGFTATKNLDDMVSDVLRFQKRNPDGYGE